MREKSKRPDGSWTEKQYDANRRLVGLTSSDAMCAYSLSLDAFGRTVAASNAFAKSELSLSDTGRATNEVVHVGTNEVAISRTFDAFGRLESTRVDAVVEDSVSYDECGRIASVSNCEATVEYFYDSEGFDTGYSLTLTSGVTFERILVRPRYMHHRIVAVTNCSSAATRSIAYTYDDLDRPVSRGNSTFAYNARGEVSRLVSVSELRCLDIEKHVQPSFVCSNFASHQPPWHNQTLNQSFVDVIVLPNHPVAKKNCLYFPKIRQSLSS